MMRPLDKCIHFYIGCRTNVGQLVGVKQKQLLIQAKDGENTTEYSTHLLGSTIFLYLQTLSDLTEEQSKELIKRGIAIGRPNGYTFSNEGFLYLLSLNVDLFSMVSSGYAKNVHELQLENS